MTSYEPAPSIQGSVFSHMIGRIRLLSVYWYRTITKHCANNASNDVNSPPLPTGGDDKNNVYYFKIIFKKCVLFLRTSSTNYNNTGQLGELGARTFRRGLLLSINHEEVAPRLWVRPAWNSQVYNKCQLQILF